MNQFIKIRDGWYNICEILAVRQSRNPSIGGDGVERDIIIQISTEAAGSPDFTTIWASREEARDVLAMLEAGKKNVVTTRKKRGQ